MDKIIRVGAVRIPILSVCVLVVTGILLVLVILVVHRSKIGMAMRALSRDMETVRLMGVDADRVISFTFVLGSTLAAAGGIMWCMKYPALKVLHGSDTGLKAFVAAVLGGIGSVGGAAMGGMVLGLAEILIVAIENRNGPATGAQIAFSILIVILLTRPPLESWERSCRIEPFRRMDVRQVPQESFKSHSTHRIQPARSDGRVQPRDHTEKNSEHETPEDTKSHH